VDHQSRGRDGPPSHEGDVPAVHQRRTLEPAPHGAPPWRADQHPADVEPRLAAVRGGVDARGPGMSRFLISCGGTGGHVSPGISLAEGLTARGHEATLLISMKKVDARLVEKY